MAISSRERHSRESAAIAGASVGCSRETVRKAGKILAAGGGLADEVVAGRLTIDGAYRRAIGDTGCALSLRLDPGTDAWLRAEAAAAGCSRQELVLGLLRRAAGVDR